MARIVVALGGNALHKNGETDVSSQQEVARQTAHQLVGLLRDGHQLVIVHGNGPQVGSILLHENRPNETRVPLDVCVAMSQGEIGYWLQQALLGELHAQAVTASVATIVTQVLVAADDPAFDNPSKPIGPFYPDEQAAHAVPNAEDFVFKEDAGRGWRRVVASPMPLDILEGGFIKQAVDGGHVVIAAGGGGIPVLERGGKYRGAEAVIDKDFAAAKLADLINADTLLILTAVDAVSINFQSPSEKTLGAITAAEVKKYIDQGQFASGSMLPKMQAALKFKEAFEGRRVIITSPENVKAAMRGEAGTRF